MSGFANGWFFTWFIFMLACAGLLRPPVTDGHMLAVLGGGFFLLLIQGEMYRKLLKRRGLKRRSFTRHPLYLPLGLALVTLVILPLYLSGTELSLILWLLLLNAALAGVYPLLVMLGQEVKDYVHSRWLDLLYPLVFLSVVAIDWAEQGRSLLWLLAVPLIFAVLGLMMIREARAMLGARSDDQITRTRHVI
ncbi:MAG: hypothetical protein FH749_01185 [Firmicutes bacterium]|nr:hypothetical protein [Bacillota bacterium]